MENKVIFTPPVLTSIFLIVLQIALMIAIGSATIFLCLCITSLSSAYVISSTIFRRAR